MHVNNGDRTFTKDNDSFGTVTRTTLFGGVSTNSSIILMDDGRYSLYVGDKLQEQVVNKDSGKDGKGNLFEIPTDVKKEGPSVLASLGIPQDNLVALFEKFMVLEKSVRRQKMKEWKECTTDENCNAFLAEFLSLLEDDNLYVSTYADILLKHLDDDLRSKMKIDFFNGTTPQERVTLINEFASVKNNKRKTEEFLQKIYKMLIDDETYWAMQLKIYGKGIYKEPDLSNKIVSYMQNESKSRMEHFIGQWRRRRIYNNSRTAVRWVKYFLRRY